MSKPTKTVSARIDRDAHKRARRLALEADKSLAEVVRELLFGWMKKQEATQTDPPADKE